MNLLLQGPKIQLSSVEHMFSTWIWCKLERPNNSRKQVWNATYSWTGDLFAGLNKCTNNWLVAWCHLLSFVSSMFFLLFLSFLSFQYQSSLFLYRFLFSLSKMSYFEESSELINVGLVDPVLQVHPKQLDLKQLEVLQIHLTWAMPLILSSNLINIVNILVYDI